MFHLQFLLVHIYSPKHLYPVGMNLKVGSGPVVQVVVGFEKPADDEMPCPVEIAVAEMSCGAEMLVPLDVVEMTCAVEVAATEDFLSVVVIGTLDIVAEIAVDRSAAAEPLEPGYQVERVYSGCKQNEVASSQSTGRGFA
jgi:hypothetical protein